MTFHSGSDYLQSSEQMFEEVPMWTMFCRDLWGPVWPNLAASVVTLPAAFVWHHRRIKAHITKTMEAKQRW